MLQQQIMEELQYIPENKLAEIYDVIHYFRLGLTQEKPITLPEQQNNFLETYINKPIKQEQFTPLKRNDIYER